MALCPYWNAMGADLQNEPHSATWGRHKYDDWNSGAERMGNNVLKACARWLIFVEGVGWKGGAPECDPDCAAVGECKTTYDGSPMVPCHTGRWVTPIVMTVYLLVANILNKIRGRIYVSTKVLTSIIQISPN